MEPDHSRRAKIGALNRRFEEIDIARQHATTKIAPRFKLDDPMRHTQTPRPRQGGPQHVSKPAYTCSHTPM